MALDAAAQQTIGHTPIGGHGPTGAACTFECVSWYAGRHHGLVPWWVPRVGVSCEADIFVRPERREEERTSWKIVQLAVRR